MNPVTLNLKLRGSSQKLARADIVAKKGRIIKNRFGLCGATGLEDGYYTLVKTD